MFLILITTRVHHITSCYATLCSAFFSFLRVIFSTRHVEAPSLPLCLCVFARTWYMSVTHAQNARSDWKNNSNTHIHTHTHSGSSAPVSLVCHS